jgi:hypothetical protein
MARKKPAKKAKKASATRKTARKAVKKAVRKAKAAVKKTVRKAAKAARKGAVASRKAGKAAGKARATARKTVKKAAATVKARVKTARVTAKAVKAGVAAAAASLRKPNLDRPRKTVADIHGVPSSLDMDRHGSAARTGRAEMQERLHKNTSSSPALTAGDVDADWQSAEAVGDEAPGGDNPTPDQDVVDEIGRALGVEYEDDEELQGGAEITERDRHRWELDPSSKDDFDEE